ncbi:14786_t:CDS:1 [Cetraspora pellucida]|uniref:14786_t:CDS:1 n=1 Tax=Cetraspora pellucida TaxID=1433469 RepID=A0A9N9EEK7_9GLOM|nr:14786_t:CDS:1 [Cetraspora pellucida]
MSLDNTTSNKNSDLQYLITFKYNYYDELIINHELVRATDNEINKEQKYIKKSDKDTNIKISTRRSKERGKDREKGRGKGKEKTKGRERGKKEKEIKNKVII